MLEMLRRGAAGWVAKIFMGVLVLSFGVWGIADIFRLGGSSTDAAVVGDRKISAEEFRAAYTNELRRVSQQAKRVITPEQARAAGLGERVLGNMVNEAAIDVSVDKLKLNMSDEAIVRLIQDDEIFRGANGAFDRATFNEILRANNLSENQYFQLQRQFSARKQLTDALSVNVVTPTALRQAIHAYNTDSRSISYLALRPEAPSAVPAPDEKALRAAYDGEKSSFRTPEFRKLAVLSVDPRSIGDKMQLTDQELRAYYDANSPKFSELEKRSIEQISYPNAEEAQAAYDQIRNGGLFEQAIVQRKLKPEDAFLGNLSKDQMFDKKIADAAFALKQGEVSPPVEGSYATVLLRVTGIQKEQVKDFDTVRDDIRDALANDRGSKDAIAAHDKIDEARLGGATLEEIARTQNIPLRIVEAVDRGGKAPDGKPVADLPQSAQLLGKAFQTEVGADSDTIGSGDSFVWYDVRGVTPPRDRSFEEARADVEARWREQEATRRLDARADAVLKGLRDGRTLDQQATAEKLTVEQAETTRSGGAPSITQEQATAVFQAPVEGFGSTAADQAGSRLVFHVTSENIRPFDPAAPDDSGQTDKIAQGMGSDVISAYVQKLRDALGTRFNTGVIAQVTGAGAG